MAEVNIKKYVKLDGKWRFVAIPKDNGKLKLTHVLVNKRPVASTSGTFYLEWRQDGKRFQRPAGAEPREALEAYRDQVDRLMSGEPVEAPVKPPKASVGVTVTEAVASCLQDVKATRSKATYRSYRPILNGFLETAKKEYVADFNRQDVIALFQAGRDVGLQQATINNHVMIIVTALRRAGAKLSLLKGDWPKATRPKVETYRQDELVKFFAACDHRERLLFQTFLCSGFRHMEMGTLTWDDIDWVDGTLAVTAKPDIGFNPKSYQERSVPIPRALLHALKAYQKSCTHKRFVFPTRQHPRRPQIGGDWVDGRMLITCKQVALRAGLNCGKCKDSKLGPCITSASCEWWYLHKFRHTFATEQLQSGMDIKTVQILMGHQRITTTERYLQGLRLSKLREKVESSSLAGFL